MDISLLDFKKIDYLYELGYAKAKKHIQKDLKCEIKKKNKK